MLVRDKILIITEKDDIHASEIIRYLGDIGESHRVVRLGIEDFPSNVKAVFDGHSFHVNVLDSGRSFSSEEIMTVWYRKPRDTFIDGFEDDGVRNFVFKEFKAFINGLYCCTGDDALWINGRRQSLVACNKFYQLRVAKEVGFNVPKLIVTNSHKELAKFMESITKICNKCISTPDFILEGEPHLYCTQVYESDEIVSNICSVDVCPTMFQQFIDKILDIRITIIGEDIFACEIHSQDNPESQVDFRLVDPYQLEHCPHVLPEDVVLMVREFVSRMGLKFSAMDLVIDKDGKYWFLENNCNGQWLWIEYLTKMPMIESMTSLLLSPSKNRILNMGAHTRHCDSRLSYCQRT